MIKQNYIQSMDKSSNFTNDLIKLLVKHGLVNKLALRDYRVKRRYKILREQGMSGKEARLKLAEEELTSEKTIQYILYGKK
jgi:hypothetical protein